MSIPLIPPMNALRAFEAAARLGSFKAASDELNVTPSAVSHQIGNLENMLGVRLFHRHGRRLLLSDTGDIYWRRVRDGLQRLAAATEGIAAAGARKNILTIVAAPSLAAKWLMPRLDGLIARHSD
ncbi:MAG: LysR family transcriptional regulator, partial [Proteobacteria bacterium]|nr:LysR family transcriptional regulator [Pseudomonadota bacterium]